MASQNNPSVASLCNPFVDVDETFGVAVDEGMNVDVVAGLKIAISQP
jgi:hypothetical protein